MFHDVETAKQSSFVDAETLLHDATTMDFIKKQMPYTIIIVLFMETKIGTRQQGK